jgi:hypothetical protein
MTSSVCTRWISICVDSFDHAVLDGGPFCRRSAWHWMIAQASWTDRTVNHKGRPLQLRRGQLVAGREFLAQRWGWTAKMVRLFLDQLVSEGMLKKGQSEGHYANVFSVVNYDTYQHGKRDEVCGEGQNRASAGPEEGQTYTRNTKLSEDSVAKATDAKASSSDRLKDALWGPCLAWLRSTYAGKLDEAKLRSRLGKLAKQHGQASVLVATLDAQTKSVLDPLDWMTKALGNAKSDRKPYAGISAPILKSDAELQADKVAKLSRFDEFNAMFRGATIAPMAPIEGPEVPHAVPA